VLVSKPSQPRTIADVVYFHDVENPRNTKSTPMHCWARYLFIAVVFVLGIGQMIAACGQKGDLYLPEPEPEPKAAEEPPPPTAEVPTSDSETQDDR
jgi:predicted small lipoprotein YifL